MQLQHVNPVIDPKKTEELNEFKKTNVRNLSNFFQNHPVSMYVRWPTLPYEIKENARIYHDLYPK